MPCGCNYFSYDQLEAGAPLTIVSPRKDLWTFSFETSGQMLKCKTLLPVRVDTLFFGFPLVVR